ncbi:MAG: hypothetical protein C0402_11340 [Thermodesulfovibrio sp.]|nr:hypothetical protein [Thermodesulfovibrio sp.]
MSRSEKSVKDSCMELQPDSSHTPQEKISQFISHVMTAVSSCSLYSEKHPVVAEFAGKMLALADELYAEDSLNFTLVGESFIVNDVPFVEKGLHIANFIKRFRKKKIDKVVFKKAPDLEEMTGFIIGMASREKVASTAHVSVGIVEVRLRGADATPASLLDDGISKVRETLHGVSRFRQLDMIGLEDAVVDFLAVLKKELNVLRIVSPVKSHNEYTYVHATNVSVLSIFQAEVLGFTGEALRDIGLAGLLHDVGKIFVTNTILDKPGKLDAGEWDDMKKHPVYGAMYLAKLSAASPLAAIVAFEHHMKFNGSGYPDTKRIGKKQHIVSQIVAIADFFDALRTERPYRKTLEVPLIAKMLQEGAGKDFNPELVGSFLVSLGEVMGREQ